MLIKTYDKILMEEKIQSPWNKGVLYQNNGGRQWDYLDRVERNFLRRMRMK
jgi:hypothetical protein